MKMSDLRDELNDEVATIMSKEFSVGVIATKYVPHSDDVAITFPNLDDKKQSCKLIDTCILYIDIRRSTELNLSHRPQTVAKLYSSFVRAMTKAARQYDGHVRGIIGDRVMVLFDTDDAFTNAMNCAFLMNSVSKYVINKHFSANEVTCGIGVDCGKMLVTKTGIRKNGQQRQNYKNLVWLGRPANVASKLTDLANKPSDGADLDTVRVAFQKAGLPEFNWRWVEYKSWEFIRHIDSPALVNHIVFDNPAFRTLRLSSEYVETRQATPPILVSRAVYAGFKAANPEDSSIKGGWFKEVTVNVPGFTDKVFGCDVHFTVFKE
ncbi:adenylate/guanylate cyclase domain-containing protein [Sphingomonas sp. Leaf28]|uniref:adenylate/guanylate cyclase domain-containing protein n=1 Tax=Sphingomonas sp. Leaf28 TaxID=1735695 RepID=UPI0006FED220|nr:adenylate/guanylate cyclase domain-containing protein [Sphingomonas sp. Leaf28]KQN09087.1 hypothetical protein ASE79_14640 [Sphingomonas sp. Leaf28]